MIRLLISLSKQTKRKGGDSIVTPSLEKSNEERLSIFAIQVPKPSSQVGKFWCCDEVVVEILNHYARKLDILVLDKAVGHGAVDLLCAESQTELSDDQVASSF
jgi:hypothetical protein